MHWKILSAKVVAILPRPQCGMRCCHCLPPGLLDVLGTIESLSFHFWTDTKWSAWEIYHTHMFRWQLGICFPCIMSFQCCGFNIEYISRMVPNFRGNMDKMGIHGICDVLGQWPPGKIYLGFIFLNPNLIHTLLCPVFEIHTSGWGWQLFIMTRKFRKSSTGKLYKNTDCIVWVLNPMALKIWLLYAIVIHPFQCMAKIICVEFQREPLKLHKKYLTHSLKDKTICSALCDSDLGSFY